MHYNLRILNSTIIPDISAGCNMPLNHVRSTFECSCSNKRKQCSYIKYTEYKLFIPHLFRASGKAPDKARINFLLCYYFSLNLCCDPPLEPFCQDGFNKVTAQDFLKKITRFLKRNHLLLSLVIQSPLSVAL